VGIHICTPHKIDFPTKASEQHVLGTTVRQLSKLVAFVLMLQIIATPKMKHFTFDISNLLCGFPRRSRPAEPLELLTSVPPPQEYCQDISYATEEYVPARLKEGDFLD